MSVATTDAQEVEMAEQLCDSVRRSGAWLTGADDVGEYLDQVHGRNLRFVQRAAAGGDVIPTLKHARFNTGPLIIDTTEANADVGLSPDPFGMVTVVWVQRGSMHAECGNQSASATASEMLMPAPPDLPHESRLLNLRTVSLLLDPMLMRAAAAEALGAQPESPLLRFVAMKPVDAGAARRLMNTIAYTQTTVSLAKSVATPLVLGSLTRLLCATVLAAFPIDGIDPLPLERRASPVLVCRAVEYIESNVDRDISVSDIAAALFVTPRTLQYLFRRHLGITPSQYVLRSRLHYAHRDLVSASAATTTVGAIAARWGFAHPGRFAAHYRRQYGRSPRVTLAL